MLRVERFDTKCYIDDSMDDTNIFYIMTELCHHLILFEKVIGFCYVVSQVRLRVLRLTHPAHCLKIKNIFHHKNP